MNIHKTITELRKQNGISQESLSEQLGVTRQAVSKWESGDSLPEINRLVEMSAIFHVTLDRMIKGKNQYDFQHAPNKNHQKLIQFLCHAKRNTYAAQRNSVESIRKKSIDYFFQEGKFSYSDSYFGGRQFSGQEIVYENQNPLWSMNYYGRVLGKNFSGDFLKESLLQVSPTMPYRGPSTYHQGDYSYLCLVKGDFLCFEGHEEVFSHHEKIYEGRFHGGLLQE
ncbi:MAG: DUF5680 domain-containing protein [Spirochaetales bacterium]|nr:DUF5680 domain-containing protein [Spirochaetales bacterium]